MSDSEGTDDTSSDTSQPAIKRRRLDTYGASSTTSHGSPNQESEGQSDDNEPSPIHNHAPPPGIYKEGSPDDDIRQSRSSISEACSSPNEDCRPSFDGTDKDKSSDEGGSSMQSNIYSSHAMRMMNKMGYKEGRGLGKLESGRVEPVEASMQRGKRGLGLKPSTLGSVPQDFKWRPDDAAPEPVEDVVWMPAPPSEDVTADQLEEWQVKGKKKMTIDDETEFCDPSILSGVLGAKNIFDTLDEEDLRKARFRSNPYETIASLFFLNRAAVKMANMDARLDFMFTDPRDLQGRRLVKDDDLLYFADVCAGPGGFSEYVLFRKRWRAKGFGFTLKGSCDFKLTDFYAGPPETFSPYYGPNEDGDIFNPENLHALRDHVLGQTDDSGVHFLMADGGFSVDGKENIQEILSKQLYLCQCLAALLLVRTGGHFVVKLFDLFTAFSVSLVYLMYRCFEQVTIMKPVTSRPANSERYLVCKWKRAGADVVERHLFQVNVYLFHHKDDDKDIVSLVPTEVLKEDTAFFDYIYKSNCVIGDRQIKNLLKIGEFCKDKSLVEESQTEMRKRCIELWKLPDEVRKQPQRLNPDDTLAKIIAKMPTSPPDANNLTALKTNTLRAKPALQLMEEKDVHHFKSVYVWTFQFLADTRQCRFYLGTGGRKVYELRENGTWGIVENIVLPAETLLYGEIVKELSGEGLTQTWTRALHVIDAVCLGGIDVSHRSITDRLRECSVFCRALSRPHEHQHLPLRCKRLFRLEAFRSALDRLAFRKLKIGQEALTIDIQSRIDSKERFHVISSLVFFKEVKNPWQAAISKTKNSKYYFKLNTNNTCTDSVDVADFKAEELQDVLRSIRLRVEWLWDPASEVYLGKNRKGLKRAEFEHYVTKKLCSARSGESRP